MLPKKPLIGDGCIVLSEGVKLCFENLLAHVKEITDIDSKMSKQWEGVYRLSLLTKGRSGTIKYCFGL